MGAEHLGLARQRGKAGEGIVHLLRAAFEQPAAAAGEQGVAAEQPGPRARLRAPLCAPLEVGDVVEGMAGHGDHLDALAEHFAGIAVVQRQVERGNPAAGRTEHAAAAAALERGDTTGVVVMMMGDEDVAQLPVRIALQPVLHRLGVTRIDHRATPLGDVLEQPDVVVGEGAQGLDAEHGGSPVGTAGARWLIRRVPAAGFRRHWS